MMGWFGATAAVVIISSTSIGSDTLSFDRGVYVAPGTRSVYESIAEIREALDDTTPRATATPRGRIQAPPELRIGELDERSPVLEERRLRWLRGRISAPREKRPRRRRLRTWEREALPSER